MKDGIDGGARLWRGIVAGSGAGNSPEPVRNRVMILERSDEKSRLSWACAYKKSGFMSR